ITRQLDELRATSGRLKALRPRQGGVRGTRVIARDYTVPLFLVSFDGWKTSSTALELIKEETVDGVLVINEGMCCGLLLGDDGHSLSSVVVEKNQEASLWLFVSCLHDCISRIDSMTAHPFHYFRGLDRDEPSPE